jgi:hypothetical protein
MKRTVTLSIIAASLILLGFLLFPNNGNAIEPNYWILKYPHLQPASSLWKIPLTALDTLIISGIDTATSARRLITITQANAAYSAQTGATTIGTLSSLTFTKHVPIAGDSSLGKLWLRSSDSSFVIGTGAGLYVIGHL